MLDHLSPNLQGTIHQATLQVYVTGNLCECCNNNLLILVS
jgi:hypothetical protein